jgi:hypothetical protein
MHVLATRPPSEPLCVQQLWKLDEVQMMDGSFEVFEITGTGYKWFFYFNQKTF